jgi:serine/threonine-protein kinase
MIGKTLGHNKIIEKLGEGGMGQVYRAHDEHLDRDVAVKVLPPDSFTDELARKRFRKEALALSKLNHPNVETVFDFDTQDGIDFLVMEYIPGQTLAEKLKAGPLPEKEISKLGTQLAEGLAAAHDQGIVHRDLKPGNLMITPDGRLKILDFGLARLVRPTHEEATTESITQSQAVAGTLPYMAPEQLRSEELDARTDIWAAGSVLYEMATAKCPFREETAPRLTDAILHQTPVTPRAINAGISTDLERLILKCLEKEPGNRYQTNQDLRVDLRQIGLPVSTSDKQLAISKRKTRTISILITALIMILTAVVLFELDVWGLRERVFGGATPRQITSIAVLPLENLSADPEQEYFADGMTEALITNLSKIGALKVISRTSVMQYKNISRSLPEIAQDLGVDSLIEGSVLRAGSQVRITVQLIYGSTDEHIWANDYQRELKDILKLQSELAREIAKEVKVAVTPEERARLADTRTVIPEAHEAYLKGLHFRRQPASAGRAKSVWFFEEALRKDPNYALAYAGLADFYIIAAHGFIPSHEAFPLTREYATKALMLDDSLVSPRTALADAKYHYEYDWDGAEEEFRRVFELDPGHSLAHAWYSGLLAAQGRFEEAVSEIELAQSRDPLLFSHYTLAANWRYYARQYDRSIEEAKMANELNPTSLPGNVAIGLAYMQKRMPEQAIAVLTEAVIQGSEFSFGSSGSHARAALARAYAAMDRKDEARRQLAELRGLAEQIYVPPHLMALVYSALNDKDTAFEWLEKAYEDRDAQLIWANVDPGFDPIRSDERFQDLLRRMKLLR